MSSGKKGQTWPTTVVTVVGHRHCERADYSGFGFTMTWPVCGLPLLSVLCQV